MSPKNQPSPSADYDIQLLFPVLFLVGIGIVMVYSASSAVALKKFGSDYLFLKKQAIFALIGIVGLVACRHFPYQWYRPLTYPLLALALLFLVAIQFTDYGFSAGGSARWLRISHLTFQPSEFARFALVVFLAYSLDKKREKIKEFSIGFLPHIFVFGVFAVCIFQQPDFGSVVILATLTWLMMFVGGVRCTHLFTSLIVLLPVAIVYLVKAEYRVKRLLSFLNPWEYPSDEGYQIVHSLMAFGTGRIVGYRNWKGLSEVILSARAPYGFHLFDYRRRDRPGRCSDYHRALRADSDQGPSNCPQRTGHIRITDGFRVDQRHGSSSLRQHGGCVGPAADQRARPALFKLRRHVSVAEYGIHRDFDEHQRGKARMSHD